MSYVVWEIWVIPTEIYVNYVSWEMSVMSTEKCELSDGSLMLCQLGYVLSISQLAYVLCQLGNVLSAENNTT